MSTTVMAACWPLQINPTPKSVLMSLADNANDQGECWPSITTICLRTCFGRTAVIEAIAWLEDHHLIAADRSNGRHTRYRILVTLDLFATNKPVRLAHQSAKRTGAAAGLDPSASRTAPVREADTNRQEPSGTKEQQRDSSRGARLPDDWVPSEAVKAWAAQRYPAINLAEALDEFRDFWQAEPGSKGLKLDWDKTFKNRLRELARKRGAQAASTTPAPARTYTKPARTPPAEAFRTECDLLNLQLEHHQIDAATHTQRIAEARQRMEARAGPGKASAPQPTPHATH